MALPGRQPAEGLERGEIGILLELAPDAGGRIQIGVERERNIAIARAGRRGAARPRRSRCHGIAFARQAQQRGGP